MRKLIFLGLMGLLCFQPTLFAWDFSSLRAGLKRDMGDSVNHSPRLVLVFKTVQREELKQRFNLIEVKRQLAHELTRSFRVADPIVTAQVMRKNSLTYDRLLGDATLSEALADRTQAELILLIAIEPEQENLSVKTKLITTSNQPLSNQAMVLGPKRNKDMVLGPKVTSRPPKEKAAKEPARQIKQPKSVVSQFGGTGGFEFQAQDFLEDHNDSWVDMNPTAFLNPMPSYFELTVWPKNLPDTDIRAKRFRYEMTLEGLAQFGVQGNGNNNMGAHSGYFHAKVPLVAFEEFSFAAGYRRRVFWNPENTEFNRGLSVDSFNDKRNRSTLFGVLSSKNRNFGVLLNGYLDNQSFGAGAKYLLTEDIMAIVDTTYNFYDQPLIKNDAAIGIQVHSPMGNVTSLTYHMESEQVLLSLGFSF